jgi:hypothetical protein
MTSILIKLSALFFIMREMRNRDAHFAALGVMHGQRKALFVASGMRERCNLPHYSRLVSYLLQ